MSEMFGREAERLIGCQLAFLAVALVALGAIIGAGVLTLVLMLR